MTKIASQEYLAGEHRQGRKRSLLVQPFEFRSCLTKLEGVAKVRALVFRCRSHGPNLSTGATPLELEG